MHNDVQVRLRNFICTKRIDGKKPKKKAFCPKSILSILFKSAKKQARNQGFRYFGCDKFVKKLPLIW